MVHTRFILKSEGAIIFIRPNDIDWLEAEGNYIRLHFGRESRLIRAQMHQLEQTLDPENFVRINRSAIVNLDFVREMKPGFRGTYQTVLRDGTKLLLSRNYREKLFGKISVPIGVRTLRVAK